MSAESEVLHDVLDKEYEAALKRLNEFLPHELLELYNASGVMQELCQDAIKNKARKRPVDGGDQ